MVFRKGFQTFGKDVPTGYKPILCAAERRIRVILTPRKFYPASEAKSVVSTLFWWLGQAGAQASVMVVL